MELELDHAGIAALLKGPEIAAAVRSKAEEVASNVAASHAPDDLVVDDYTTDRAASSVTIRDSRARQWQAEDGVLTQAAAAAGLEVTSR